MKKYVSVLTGAEGNVQKLIETGSALTLHRISVHYVRFNKTDISSKIDLS